MKVYIVSVDGDIWGAYSTMELAVLQACSWISRCHETFMGFTHHTVGCTIKTDMSKWDIQELVIDKEVEGD